MSRGAIVVGCLIILGEEPNYLRRSGKKMKCVMDFCRDDFIILAVVAESVGCRSTVTIKFNIYDSSSNQNFMQLSLFFLSVVTFSSSTKYALQPVLDLKSGMYIFLSKN
jgi:hypothetical protein